MFERIKKARQQEHEGGFTLIELLVVIAILGILAAIVVFSVAGIQDKGQLSACKIDTQTLQTAEEANFAVPGDGGYVDMPTLQAHGFLSTLSTLHSVVANPPGAGTNTYYLLETGTTCGTAGHAASAVPAGTTGAPVYSGCGGTGPNTGPGLPLTQNWGDC